MASTTTTNVALEKIADGEQENTWGSTERETLDELDKLLCGVLDVSVAGGTDVTLTRAQYLNPVLTFSGTITANINVIFPTIDKPWIIKNATSGSFTLTAKTSAGSGSAITQGNWAFIHADSTNVVKVTEIGTMAAQVASAVAITGGTITGITDLAVADGGTGASTAGDARTNLAAAGTGIVNTFTKTQIWKKGANIVSATTLVLGTDGNFFNVTGTTNIDGITVTAGTFFMLQFNGVLTLGDSATFDLAGADLITIAGDRVTFFAIADNDVILMNYYREGGKPLLFATQANQEAGTDPVKAVSSGRQHYHQSAVKAWLSFEQIGTHTVFASYNIAGIADGGTAGETVITIATDFSSVNYCSTGMTGRGAAGPTEGRTVSIGADPTAGVLSIAVVSASDTQTDAEFVSVSMFGDQG